MAVIKRYAKSIQKNEVSTVFEIDSIITNDPTTIANNLNEYFVNIGPMLDKTILREQTTFDKFLTGSYVSFLVLTSTVPNEIVTILVCVKCVLL